MRKQSGTVLLLGRSGTGKTLCLMDRMHHDRIQLQLRHFNSLSLAASVDTSAGADDSAVADASTGVANCSTNSNSSSTGSCSESRPPSQLFVARSLQLCELVKRYQQHNAMDSSNMDIANYYMRMRQFLADMERKLMCTQRASSATSDDGATSPGRYFSIIIFCRLWFYLIFPILCL